MGSQGGKKKKEKKPKKEKEKENSSMKMEWPNFQQGGEMERQFQQDGGDTSNGLCVKVMTDEQMELLRKQIAVYAMICEQLVQMHKVFSAQNEIAGLFSFSFLF